MRRTQTAVDLLWALRHRLLDDHTRWEPGQPLPGMVEEVVRVAEIEGFTDARRVAEIVLGWDEQ